MGHDTEKKIDSISKLLLMLFLLPMPGGMRNRACPKGRLHQVSSVGLFFFGVLNKYEQ